MLGANELIHSFVLVLLVKQDSNNGEMLFSLRIELWLASIDYCLIPLESARARVWQYNFRPVLCVLAG